MFFDILTQSGHRECPIGQSNMFHQSAKRRKLITFVNRVQKTRRRLVCVMKNVNILQSFTMILYGTSDI